MGVNSSTPFPHFFGQKAVFKTVVGIFKASKLQNFKSSFFKSSKLQLGLHLLGLLQGRISLCHLHVIISLSYHYLFVPYSTIALTSTTCLSEFSFLCWIIRDRWWWIVKLYRWCFWAIRDLWCWMGLPFRAYWWSFGCGQWIRRTLWGRGRERWLR